MPDALLLVCGCGVTFLAIVGGYVYLRECFEERERQKRLIVRPVRREARRLRDVA